MASPGALQTVMMVVGDVATDLTSRGAARHQPGIRGLQRRNAARRGGAQPYVMTVETGERATGIEPATFSLGS